MEEKIRHGGKKLHLLWYTQCCTCHTCWVNWILWYLQGTHCWIGSSTLPSYFFNFQIIFQAWRGQTCLLLNTEGGRVFIKSSVSFLHMWLQRFVNLYNMYYKIEPVSRWRRYMMNLFPFPSSMKKKQKNNSYTICHNLFRKLNTCSSAPKPHKPMHNCIVPGSANTLLSDPLVPPM